MKQKKKNGFFTFICSFLPGAAEMYMGFMRMGLSLMIVFFLSFLIPTMFYSSDIFIGLAFIVWFFGFFHARNLAAASDETFDSVEDKFIWDELAAGKVFEVPGEKARKWIAAILIIFGFGMLWDCCQDVILRLVPNTLWNEIYPIVSRVPSVAFAIVIVVIGIKMILGKKEALNGENDKNA